MKFIINYILTAVAVVLLLNACKKDLGNYSYSKVNIPVIDTTGIGSPKYIERYATLNIKPVIHYDGGNIAALKYQWIIYPFVTGSTPSATGPKQVGTALNLNVPIAQTVGEYRLELIVTDTVNQLKANMIFTVVVSIGIEYGVMVLHAQNDSADVDFLITADAVPISGILPRRLRNIYSSSTGSKFPGIPAFIAQERRSNSVSNWILLGSNQHLSRMSGSDFSFIRKDQAFFRRTDEAIAPSTFMLLSNSYGALINGGKLYLYNTTYETDALFGGAVTGDYDLAPQVTYGTSSSLVAVAYDKKYGRFIHAASTSGAMIDFIAPAVSSNHAFDLRNIGKDLLKMEVGFTTYTHAFFKDRTGNGYWLYVINFNKSDDGNLVVGAYDMTALPEIQNAKFFQSSELGYTDLYATDRKVYSYNYQGTGLATLEFDGLPAGETITAMKIYKPRPNFNLSAVDGRLLYIATWDGTQGRVYEYTFNAISGQITTPARSVTDGYGKVYDITAKARGAGTY